MEEYFYNDSELQMDTTFILCIEELITHDSYSSSTSSSSSLSSSLSSSQELLDSIDTRLFIGWDERTNDFFIRGRRQDVSTESKWSKLDIGYVPYAFHCKTINDLYSFIKFTMSKKGNVILYNFNNINLVSTDKLTYEFFESRMDTNYEISGYNNIILKRSRIVNYLKILQNTYNWQSENEEVDS